MEGTQNRRLWTALAAYAVLGGIAFLRLHGTVLYAVLILLAGLMAKTVIADRAGWTSPRATGAAGSPEDGNREVGATLEHEPGDPAQNGPGVPGRESDSPGSH